MKIFQEYITISRALYDINIWSSHSSKCHNAEKQTDRSTVEI